MEDPFIAGADSGNVAPMTVDNENCGAESGYLHFMADALATYRFNTGTAQHLFCKVCGIKSFYVPRSHPDGYSVNARCLDSGSVKGMKVRKFNGADWEKSAREKKWAS